MVVTVEQELKKNVKLSKADIEIIREWMEKQPHLPKITDLNIISFLHSCYYSVEKAKHTIEIHYTARTHAPEFFSNRDPNHETITGAYNSISVYTLPEKTHKEERVICANLNDHNPSHFVLADCLKYFLAVTDLMVKEHGTDVGHRIVINMEGLSIGFLTRLHIMPIKKILFYLQEAMAARLAGFHFINAVHFTDKILSIIKPFLKPELIDLIHIHVADDMQNFHKFVPHSILPQDLGGNAPSVVELREMAYENVKNNKDFFAYEETLRVDESLRPDDAQNARNIYGVEGTFKKLDID